MLDVVGGRLIGGGGGGVVESIYAMTPRFGAAGLASSSPSAHGGVCG